MLGWAGSSPGSLAPFAGDPKNLELWLMLVIETSIFIFLALGALRGVLDAPFLFTIYGETLTIFL